MCMSWWIALCKVDLVVMKKMYLKNVFLLIEIKLINP